jgi:bifunctional DNA-binding transcriptional regulator/antitoxin component of YhaV-PrlF toxin-antitoxin module
VGGFAGLRYHGSTVVGEHGQIRIPTEARLTAGMSEGDTAVLLANGNGELVVVEAEAAAAEIRQGLRDLLELQRALQDDGVLALDVVKSL